MQHGATMSRPMFLVDFNEMVDENTVLLSVGDTKVDALGIVVQLHEGLPISVYMDDLGDSGNVDNLLANGVVVKNKEPGWSAPVKWCCRIDEDGIRSQSEVRKIERN
ncbi:hypothetical protein N5I87_04515 [Ralstonia sp. CHL-2022]|uniref:Uncharacterized protein n=1 Tax=Ralstonia mojiangensis TaxID=2953895 RepID=A0AAE3LB77_9RALS|nr:hypothetical protein [Ralstonia mojiangensis]MCT7315257.1 hypothetical protein [Ralstonia mojiangensis]